MNTNKFWIALDEDTAKRYVKGYSKEGVIKGAERMSQHCRGEKFYILGLEEVICSELNVTRVEVE